MVIKIFLPSFNGEYSKTPFYFVNDNGRITYSHKKENAKDFANEEEAEKMVKKIK